MDMEYTLQRQVEHFKDNG